jgi:MFS family permease
MNGLQALPQWQEHMDSPTGVWLGFINAIYYVGTASNAPIAAAVNNRFGRKVGVYTGYVMLIIGVALCGPNSEVAFLMSRFFIGCSTAYFTNAVPLLMNEIAYPTHRGIVSALFMSGWYVGGTLAAFITFGTRNMQSSLAWRVPTICQLIIPMIALPGLLMSPESPRWLISMNRTDEARVVLQNIHAGGATDSALVAYEVSEISNAIAIEKEISANASYLDMIKTRGNRHRLFISISLGVFSQWCGNGVVSYYLAMVLSTVGITSVTDQTLISVGLNIWNLLWSVAAAFCVDRLGRRPLFFASVATMLVGYAIVTGLSGAFAQSGQSATGIAVIPFLFVFFAGYDLAM